MPAYEAEEFFKKFKSLGYDNINNEYKISETQTTKGWFSLRDSPKWARNVAYLDYKPRLKSYSIALSIFNEWAIDAVRMSMGLISTYRHPALSHTDFLHALTFDAGVAQGWPLCCIPSPINREKWREQFYGLETDLLVGRIWKIKSPEGIADFFINDDSVFKWRHCDGVIRISYIVALLISCGYDDESIKQKLIYIPFNFIKVIADRDIRTEFIENIMFSMRLFSSQF